jgi:thymidylate kinase
MERFKFFICFVGTDGSGKSTLACDIYEKLLQDKKTKVRKIYGRHQPFLTRFVVALGRRLFIKEKNMMYSDYDRYLNHKRIIYRKAAKFVQLYISLLIIEYYAQMLFKIIMPYKLGYSIVSDRYVYDTVINDLAVERELSFVEVTKILGKFWSFIPRPDITFLIQVPEEVALERKKDIPSLNYLRIRNEFYKYLATEECFVILNGESDLFQLENHVFGQLQKLKNK